MKNKRILIFIGLFIYLFSYNFFMNVYADECRVSCKINIYDSKTQKKSGITVKACSGVNIDLSRYSQNNSGVIGWSTNSNCKTLIKNNVLKGGSTICNKTYYMCYNSNNANTGSNNTQKTTTKTNTQNVQSSTNNTNNNTNSSNNSGQKTNEKKIYAARWLVTAYDGMSCGTPLYIHSCYTLNGVKVCDFSDISDTNSVLGQINSNFLTDNISKTNGCTTKGPKYPIQSGVLSDGKTKYECGEELYITSCSGTTCYIGGIGGTISDKYYGTINSDLLKSNVDNTASYCKKTNEETDGKNEQCNGTCNINLYDTKTKKNHTIGVKKCEGTKYELSEYIDTPSGFKGWSTSSDCQTFLNNGLIEGDYCNKTYYMCYDINDESNEEDINDEEIDVEEVIDEESHEVDIYNNIEGEESNIEETPNKNVEINKCNNTKKTNQKVSAVYEFCYNKNNFKNSYELENEIKKYYLCDEKNGYKFDSTYFYPLDAGECDNKTGNCNRLFAVRCVNSSNNVKPVMNVTMGSVNSSGRGVITVKATAIQGDIVGFYYSENKVTPTHIDLGWQLGDNDELTIEHTVGTIYVWAKDSYDNISNPVTATIYDSVNSDTTVKLLQVKDSNGKVINIDSTVSDNSNIVSNKYVMMSNNLRNDSKVLAESFNPFNMEYKMEVDSPTVSVYATLTSTDSKYVQGYEPRTVNLDYGLNTVLIKVQDKEGKIRTYTILVNRVDNRNSDNTLKNITLSEGSIDFNANVTDYKIEISKNTNSVDVKANITSDKASYVSGYEPGIVNINGDSTVKIIKVKSQTGSTRTYVLTFVKKGTDIIEDETLMIEKLSIPGVYIPFEESVSNYSISVGYEISFINIKTSLKDNTSTIKFRSKRKSESNFVEGSTSGVLLDVGENFFEIIVKNKEGKTSTYRITVIRKEVGLGISNDNTLKDLKVFGYDINFKPEKREYVVKIKQEKTLVISAVPNSNRAEVFIRGNEELTGFSTVRVKVVAENGEYETYSIDIKKDPFNKVVEIAAMIAGITIVIGGSIFIVIKKRRRSNKEYFEE